MTDAEQRRMDSFGLDLNEFIATHHETSLVVITAAILKFAAASCVTLNVTPEAMTELTTTLYHQFAATRWPGGMQ